MAAQTTYLVMEVTDDLLIGLFAAWQAEIDSLPLPTTSSATAPFARC